ncbi:hypothetical protein SBA6_1100035 [Candidatus Sulfopaludibacter sp. SbA6]|nr:hypothetical protein SBA6_1100035 [Candidatus Sulfopaludibacter sp. SbA6]
MAFDGVSTAASTMGKPDNGPPQAELEKHVSSIQVAPKVEGKKGHYIAEAGWNLLGGYGEGTGNPATKRIRMVAGACLKAIHNALAAWLVRRWALPRNGRRPCRR